MTPHQKQTNKTTTQAHHTRNDETENTAGASVETAEDDHVEVGHDHVDAEDDHEEHEEHEEQERFSWERRTPQAV